LKKKEEDINTWEKKEVGNKRKESHKHTGSEVVEKKPTGGDNEQNDSKKREVKRRRLVRRTI